MTSKTLLAAALAVLACTLTAAAQNNLGQIGQGEKFEFTKVGADQKQALRVNDAIYQAIGFGNTFLVTTTGGNVIIDTSSAATARRHHELLTQVSQAPVRFVVLTHGHGDHTGGVHLWKQDGTQVVTQRHFPEFCAYQDRLAMYFARANAAQFNLDEAQLRKLYQSENNKIVPAITFDQRYEFTLGDTTFEVLSTPGETPDALTVWIPRYRAAFVGDNLYDSFPNIYTLRGTTPRWALDYVRSIDTVLALKPEIVLPSHGLPIVGADQVARRLTKYRDAIQFVHDATVRGMNEGRDVYTLMREVRLPAELDLGETYGKVAWSVRGIYEGYVGWFDLNPATMYAAPPNVADDELVAMAGGPDAVARRSQEITGRGDAVKGLHLAEAALARQPGHRGAIEAKLAALAALQSKTRNGLEHAWLGYGIRQAQAQLNPTGGGGSKPASAATPKSP